MLATYVSAKQGYEETVYFFIAATFFAVIFIFMVMVWLGFSTKALG